VCKESGIGSQRHRNDRVDDERQRDPESMTKWCIGVNTFAAGAVVA